MYYKTVNLPICVPNGKYCAGLNNDGEYTTCEHFDNYENDKCTMGFYDFKRDANYDLVKDPLCAGLLTIEDK